MYYLLTQAHRASKWQSWALHDVILCEQNRVIDSLRHFMYELILDVISIANSIYSISGATRAKVI